ncbi:MAG: SurA N-terminal domain-containing protein [Actinomycetota bacterium]|nr:SurA N-terminal domain-containing protein [Actinomycetota bacterium]
MRIVRSCRVFAGALISGAFIAGLALTGCGSATAGAAAIVGQTRISEQALTASVQEVLVAQQKSPNTSDASLTSAVLSRLVTSELVELLAAEAGVTVTQGAIDSTLQSYVQQAGGEAEVQDILLQRNVAPSQIEAFVRTNVLARLLGQALAPAADLQGQSDAFVAAIIETSLVVGTEVSPRFGTWDATQLTIGPVPSDLSALPAQ